MPPARPVRLLRSVNPGPVTLPFSSLPFPSLLAPSLPRPPCAAPHHRKHSTVPLWSVLCLASRSGPLKDILVKSSQTQCIGGGFLALSFSVQRLRCVPVCSFCTRGAKAPRTNRGKRSGATLRSGAARFDARTGLSRHRVAVPLPSATSSRLSNTTGESETESRMLKCRFPLPLQPAARSPPAAGARPASLGLRVRVARRRPEVRPISSSDSARLASVFSDKPLVTA